jgi:hypothetical protein
MSAIAADLVSRDIRPTNVRLIRRGPDGSEAPLSVLVPGEVAIAMRSQGSEFVQKALIHYYEVFKAQERANQTRLFLLALGAMSAAGASGPAGLEQ